MNWELLKYLKVNFAPPGEEGAEAVVVEDPAPQEEQQEDPAPSPEPEPTVPKSLFDQRISYLTKQKKELERQLELRQLEQELVPPKEKTPNVLEEAQAIAANMRFQEKVDAIGQAGATSYPDFQTKIVEMRQLHGDFDPSFIATVGDLGDSPQEAAEMFYALASDSARAAKILGMTPGVKQVRELEKIRTEILEGKVAKKAGERKEPPAPIAPKVGVGTAPASKIEDLSDPKMPIDDWMAKRNAEAKAKRCW